ncbi:indole-3-glycerol phosphate synthase TrpC [Ferroacidibacillus organovorans]|uniref:Indole-3-glycerol phosphate synthase n=1 Tax=Ferroacidibacillus organovorans TaxID=1765683 RepID=A0A853KEF0_9BACL|nr:indole-3-glycerol phosphate synthase TrpC [Ferroacidibacillus organovorans]KYP80515.1 hypothetical protein AYJ22_02425 [Ferroacidibacillus organovorans]OAG94744.1 hypothetical protein AYW79_04190 [Ferroacidibacillus organovorans]
MTILDRILATKKEEVEALNRDATLEEWKDRAQQGEPVRGFLAALERNAPNSLIAEIKKASPSKGVIVHSFDPAQIAQTYEQANAAALSVLTDRTYFQGSIEALQRARQSVALPVLRKDFIIDPLQVYEARAIGADAILLIVAALPDERLFQLYELARMLTMDVLIEVHNAEEVQRIMSLKPALIGVNHRNLHTFEVDLSLTAQIAPLLPKSVLLVAESGIQTHAQVETLKQAGARAFLIGETLMRAGVEHVSEQIDDMFIRAR